MLRVRTPYYPNKKRKSKCFIVKVYHSKDKEVYWLNRCFGNLNSVVNSYIHRYDWRGSVYCVYEYPTYSFIELLTYTDNGVRVCLTDPEARELAGSYIEGWGIVKD